jgi:hypothetical protein
MKDIILYIPDLEAFRFEGQSLALKRDPLFSFDNGKLVYNIERIPVCYNGNESVCLVKGLDSDVERLSSVKILGTCINKKYIFDTPECEVIYDRVIGPLEVTDNEVGKYYKPKIIGVFA